MAQVQDLVEFFTKGVDANPERTIGIEVETHFVEPEYRMVSYAPAALSEVRRAFLRLGEFPGWTFDEESLSLVTHDDGSRVLFELGRQNIELAMAPVRPDVAIETMLGHLDQVRYVMAEKGLEALSGPILENFYGAKCDLLAVPDSRDTTWVNLDGRDALNLLARCASVQFTLSVSPEKAIQVLNRLNGVRGQLLQEYPQDAYWKKYIKDSHAPYELNRYGGPDHYDSIEDYCIQLSRHAVVSGNTLVEFSDFNNLDIPLYLRSIWWHFRLKRYNNVLCIECRPFPRLADSEIRTQLETVLSIAYSD